MLDARRGAPSSDPRFWLWAVPTAGAAAGIAGGALFAAVRSPGLALGLCAAVPAIVVVIAAPYASLYVLLGAMIAEWPSIVLKLGGFGMACSTLLWALARQRRLVPRDGLLLLYTPLLLVIWLAAFKVGQPEIVNRALTYTSYLVLYWMLSTLAIGRRSVRNMILAMLVSGVMVAAFAFVQFAHPSLIWIESTSRPPAGVAIDASVSAFAEIHLDQVGGLSRIESVTGTADYLGLTMHILLPFAFFWALRLRAGSQRVLGFGVCFLLGGALILSFTRAVILSLAIITLPMFAGKVGWRRSLPYLVGAALIVLPPLLLWDTARERLFSTVTEWMNADVTTAGGWRRALLPIAMSMFLDHFWTGVGLGQQTTLWATYAPPELIPSTLAFRIPLHNGYLLLGIETGVAGFVLIVTLVVAAWIRLRRLQTQFRQQGDSFLCDMASAAEVAWVGLAFDVAFYPSLDGSFRYYWVLLALIGALSRVSIDAAIRRPVRVEAAAGVV